MAADNPHYVKCDQNNRPHPVQDDCRNPIDVPKPEKPSHYVKLQNKIAKTLAILNSNQGDYIEVSDVDRSQAKNVLDAIWPEIEEIKKEAFNDGIENGQPWP